jgi:hypothetical protein
MSQPKDFLQFLTNESGQSYRKNNGIVQAVATHTPLPQTADGWQEKSIRFTRNTKWWGSMRSFTTPLKFVKDGAMIIRDRLIKKGTNEKLFLVILWLDKTFGGGWVHRSLYKGEIDLTNTVSEDSFVTTNIMEGGLQKFIKANENTPYEIPLDVPEAILVEVEGLPLNFTAKWTSVTEDLFTASQGDDESFFSAMSLYDIQSENQSLYLTAFSNVGGKVVNFGDSLVYFSETSAQLTLRFQFNIKFRLSQDSDCRDTLCKIELRDETGAVLKEFFSFDPPDGNFDQNFDLNFDETVVVPANKRLFLGFLLNCRRQLIGTGEAVIVAYLTETLINVTYTQAYQTEYKKALRPAYVAQQLINKMTKSSAYTFKSDYLTEEWENLVVTSGNEARGLSGSVLKTSWNDFLESYNVPCNLSVSYSPTTASVEKKSEAFKPGLIYNVGSVREFNWKTTRELLFSNFKIGYPDINYENVNGKYEFNTLQTWMGPLEKVTASFELISKYRADSYGFAFAQLEGAGKNTTDLSSDNDVFFLHVEKNATVGVGAQPALFYKLLRKPYVSITGLLQPTKVWNMEISPKRCLEAHGNYLRSIFYWETGQSLTLSKAEKDTALKTVDADGNIIEERAPVFIGNLAEPLFIPVELRGEGRITREIVPILEEDANGTIAMESDGFTMYGFPMDIGIQPANGGSQETVLLCSPQTDITKLIH